MIQLSSSHLYPSCGVSLMSTGLSSSEVLPLQDERKGYSMVLDAGSKLRL